MHQRGHPHRAGRQLQLLPEPETDVFLSGSPSKASAGTYFFAVLSPGGQPDPTGPDLLSSDPATNREFSLSTGGTITPLNSSTHALDSANNVLQVAPFNATPNNGGVYILAICKISDQQGAFQNPVTGGDCKFDAFKVQSSITQCDPTTSNCPVIPNSNFGGTKWLDPNADGEFEPGETGLANWTIDIYDITSGTPVLVDQELTASAGDWGATDISGLQDGPATYRICEELQTGWNQTGPDANDAAAAQATAVGGSTVSLDTGTGSDCYDVSVPKAGDTVNSLDFFNQPTYSLSGNKWLDDDADGHVNSSVSETGLQNWKVTVTNTNTGQSQMATTDSTGHWSITGIVNAAAAGASTPLQVCEVQQTGWNQTGPDATAAGKTTGTGGASAALDTITGASCYDVSIPGGVLASESSLDFFNEPTGTLSGEKYFDANRSGLLDSGESGISGWKIQLTGTGGLASGYSFVAQTGLMGAFSVSGLVPGSYTVSEVLPTNLCGSLTVNCWQQTGNVGTDPAFDSSGGASASLALKTYTVSASAPTGLWTVSGLDFGNVCLVNNSNGLTLGFWSNNNGQAILSKNWSTLVNLVNNQLWLVGPSGKSWARFTVAPTYSATAYTAFRNWLLNATSTNASYMLSVQLLTAALDISVNGMPDYLVKNPVSGQYQSLSSLITAVGSASPAGFIELNPNTTASGTTRNNAVAYQTLFNALNNNQASVTSTDGSNCPAKSFAP